MPRILYSLVASLVLLVTASAASAQTYPDKPIRIVVTVTPGSAPDLIGRLLAEEFTRRYGQPAVVENRAGANGIIASQAVATAPADGYTMLLVGASHAINAAVYKKLPYDTVKDFVPVAMVGTAPGFVLLVNNNVRAGNLQEFIELAKRPGVAFGSAGVGSPLHLAGEVFNQTAGTRMLHIPYKGGAAVLTGVMSGEIQGFFQTPPAAIPAVRAGHVRALAVTSRERIPGLPDVPTLAEAGLPGYRLEAAWIGLFAPAATPAAVVQRINQMTRDLLDSPRFLDQLKTNGLLPSRMNAAEFKTFFNTQLEAQGRAARAANIQVE